MGTSTDPNVTMAQQHKDDVFCAVQMLEVVVADARGQFQNPGER
jgi:hypothetical protein